MRTPFAMLAPIPLLLTASAAPARTPDAAARFDPIAFFSGHTRGTGRLKVALRPAHAIDMRSYGRVVDDGVLVLSQIVEEHGKDPKRREWRIRAVGGGRYAGTLSDAVGPVVGQTVGGRLKLSYRMKRGLRAVQWIEAAPDGTSARNRMTVSRMGVPVAQLDETIRRRGL